MVSDTTSDSPGVPDIRVGVAELMKGLHFIGLTYTKWDASRDAFLPDVVLSIEDPSETPVTQLPNGDFRYQGESTTVFQDFLHELGHAIGLDHNLDDPTSIMNPVLGPQNSVPDNQDIAAVQSLYGAAREPPVLGSAEAATLHALVPGLSV